MDDRISIGARLSELARERPDRPAITDDERTLTWAELDRRTNRIARALEKAGVKQGDLVTIGLPNGVGFIEAVYGLWKVGATPQPISWRLPAHEAEAVMDAGRDSDPDRRRHHREQPPALRRRRAAGALGRRQPARGPHRADLQGADLRRIDRPAEADPRRAARRVCAARAGDGRLPRWRPTT